MKRTLYTLLLASVNLGPYAYIHAQDKGPAVGEWRALFSYYQATAVATGSDEVYCGTKSGFFTYNIEDEVILSYSKVNGMHDVGIRQVAHDPYTGLTLIGYENSNMDIFENGSFKNVPDIMISPIVGDKTIMDIIAHQGFGYVGTPIGLVITDLKAGNILNTVQFYNGSVRGKVNSSAIIGDTIFISSDIGMYKTSWKSNNIHDYSTWIKINDLTFNKIVANNETLYGLSDDHTIYQITPAGASTLFYESERNISTIYCNAKAGIWIGEEYQDGESGSVFQLNDAGTKVDSTIAFFPTSIATNVDGKLFFTDRDETKTYGGLRLKKDASSSQSLTPDGPESNNSTNVWAYNGEIWMAHGGRNYLWQPMYYGKMFSSRVNDVWHNYGNTINSLGISFLSDAIYIYKDRSNNHVYATMAAGGLIELKPDGTIRNYKNGFYELAGGDPNIYIGSGITQDSKGNLWLSNQAANYELKVKTTTDEWYSFHLPSNSSRGASEIIVDNNDNKWFIIPNNGGIGIFNENGTFTNTTDDKSRILREGEGRGNLPSNNAFTLAKDKDGSIWVGTSSGIVIFSIPNDALEKNADGRLTVLKYDGIELGNYLFHGITVNSIAVDGNNNKWVGTAGSGLWLVAEDGTEAILQFTMRNSPLPSDNIIKVDIDPVLGDVYISTDKGLMVYRGTATDPSLEVADELFIYPNPVTPDFHGQIAINGLPARTDIRITDVSGNLVYHTQVEGGQATWNGKDYTGKRPQSGVYLVLVSDRMTGKLLRSGKIVFQH